jgi:hypothetical protein
LEKTRPLPRARPRASPTRPLSDARIDEMGKRLVWLAGHEGDPDEVARLARAMQATLLERTTNRLREEGYPLPEYLVAGQALELTILEGQRKPTTAFTQLLGGQLDVAIEYVRLAGMFVDRWILGKQGATTLQQARFAAVVEACIGRPIRERRVFYRWLKDGLEPAEVARDLRVPEGEVRAVIVSIVREARPRIQEWLHSWQPVAAKPRRRRRRT